MLRLLPVVETVLLAAILLVKLLLDAEEEIAELGHLGESFHLTDVFEAVDCALEEESCAHGLRLLSFLQADLDEVLATQATRAELVNLMVDLNKEPVERRHQRHTVLLNNARRSRPLL